MHQLNFWGIKKWHIIIKPLEDTIFFILRFRFFMESHSCKLIYCKIFDLTPSDYCTFFLWGVVVKRII